MKDGQKWYCASKFCKNEIEEPTMCCDGRECGCGGMPIDPPYCNGCENRLTFSKE